LGNRNPSAVGPAYAGDWEPVLPGSSAIAKVQAVIAKRIARRQRMILTLAPPGWDVTLSYTPWTERSKQKPIDEGFSECRSRQGRVVDQRLPQRRRKRMTAFETRH